MKSKFVLFSLIFLAGLLASCSNSPQPVQTRSSAAPWDSVDVANTANPYDSVGYLHDLAMDFVAPKANGIKDPIALKNDVYQFFYQRWGTPVDSQQDYYGAIDSILAIYPASPQVVKLVDSLATLLSSAEVQTDLKTVDVIIRNWRSYTRSTVLSTVKTVESQVIVSSTLSSYQKMILECYFATVRYSYAYWTSSSGSQYPYPTRAQPKSKNTILSLDSGQTGSTIQDDCIGYAEGMAEGFVAGGFAGAIIGSAIVPGAGTIGGAAGGAVEGSLSGGIEGAAEHSVIGAATGQHEDGFEFSSTETVGSFFEDLWE